MTGGRWSPAYAVVAQVSLRMARRGVSRRGEKEKGLERGRRGSLKCDSQSQGEPIQPRSSSPQQPGGIAVLSNKRLTGNFSSTVLFQRGAHNSLHCSKSCLV